MKYKWDNNNNNNIRNKSGRGVEVGRKQKQIHMNKAQGENRMGNITTVQKKKRAIGGGGKNN